MSNILLTDLLEEKKIFRPRHSYGILAYLTKPFRVLLAHPGGPELKHKIHNSWSIPKGGRHSVEDGWEAALREFKEETGLDLPENIKEKDAINLGAVTQKGGKIVRVWAVEMEDDDISSFKSNTFLFQWSDENTTEYPEIDKIKYFSYGEAKHYLRPDQWPFIQRLINDLKRPPNKRE